MKKGCIVMAVIVLQLVLIGWLWVKFFRSEDEAAPTASTATTTAALASGTAVKVAAVPLVPPPPTPELTLADLRLFPSLRPLTAKLAVAARNSRSGMVIDLTNRQVLWERNADTPVPIASMTKMMTAYLLLRAVYDDRQVTLRDMVPVTRTAENIGGSQVWLAQGETFPLEELAKCMMIKSANDATELIAEYLAGGKAAAFVENMNSKAQQLGLNHCRFYNAHGLPPDKTRRAPENSGSAREMAFLASRLLEYPDAVRWASIKSDRLIHQKDNKVTQLVNHNKLVVGGKPGVNGMKTGYTEKARYCTTVTCTINGRTMIVVLTGCEGLYGRTRDAFAGQLLDWAYAQKPAAAPAAAPATATAVPPAAVAPRR